MKSKIGEKVKKHEEQNQIPIPTFFAYMGRFVGKLTYNWLEMKM